MILTLYYFWKFHFELQQPLLDSVFIFFKNDPEFILIQTINPTFQRLFNFLLQISKDLKEFDWLTDENNTKESEVSESTKVKGESPAKSQNVSKKVSYYAERATAFFKLETV